MKKKYCGKAKCGQFDQEYYIYLNEEDLQLMQNNLKDGKLLVTMRMMRNGFEDYTHYLKILPSEPKYNPVPNSDLLTNSQKKHLDSI